MANDQRKSGMSLPAGIRQRTMQPEPAPAEGEEAPDLTTSAKASTRSKKKKAVVSEKVEDMKLYLTEDVRFRLRMLAFKRGAKLSAGANEVLDKALLSWTLKRTELGAGTGRWRYQESANVGLTWFAILRTYMMVPKSREVTTKGRNS